MPNEIFAHVCPNCSIKANSFCRCMSLSDVLRLFNSHSCDPVDHFKLVSSVNGGRDEVRLCNSHPRFITCSVDGDWINVRGSGPESLFLRFDSSNPQSLFALLSVLHEHKEEGDELVDWELEDWVGAGYPCRLRGSIKDLHADDDLGFSAADLWCVELFPSIDARLV